MPQGRILDLRWNALLKDFRRSGLTQAEFCHRRGLSLHSFRKHLYQRPTPKPTPADPLPADAAPAAHFLPVTVLSDPIPAHAAAASPPSLELLLAKGRRIAVAPGFDPATLRQLIAVLEEPPCSD